MSTGRQEAQDRENLAAIMLSVRALMNNQCVSMISDVGDQHLKLLQKFDDFGGSILYGHLDTPELDNLVQDFVVYLKVHFTVEEALMAIIEYSDRATHQHRHRRFLEDVGRMIGQIHLSLKSNEELGNLIGSWLLEHESAADSYLAKYVEHLC